MLILELNTIGTRTTGTTVVTTISYSGSSVTSLCRYWRKTCNNEKNLTKWEKKETVLIFITDKCRDTKNRQVWQAD